MGGAAPARRRGAQGAWQAARGDEGRLPGSLRCWGRVSGMDCCLQIMQMPWQRLPPAGQLAPGQHGMVGCGGSAAASRRSGETPTRPSPALTGCPPARWPAEKGKYVRTHHRLDVQPTGRYLLNEMLTGCMAKAVRADTGPQD